MHSKPSFGAIWSIINNKLLENTQGGSVPVWSEAGLSARMLG